LLCICMMSFASCGGDDTDDGYEGESEGEDGEDENEEDNRVQKLCDHILNDISDAAYKAKSSCLGSFEALLNICAGRCEYADDPKDCEDCCQDKYDELYSERQDDCVSQYENHIEHYNDCHEQCLDAESWPDTPQCIDYSVSSNTYFGSSDCI